MWYWPNLKSQREIIHTSEDNIPIINIIIFQMNSIFAFIHRFDKYFMLSDTRGTSCHSRSSNVHKKLQQLLQQLSPKDRGSPIWYHMVASPGWIHKATEVTIVGPLYSL